MKVYLSFDFEGVAGVVDWAQCREGTAAYDIGCALTLGEVNAAIAGAVRGGATEVVVNDSHGQMRNLDPAALVHEATYITGRHKPLYMMEGLDESFDVIFFLGYHGSISGESSTLSHTYNPEVISAVRIGGAEVGESGLNALVAGHFGVPIGLVTGDALTIREAAAVAPDAVSVVTKRSITRFAAANLHPLQARAEIEQAADEAVRHAMRGRLAVPRVDLPVRVEVDVHTADMAEVGSWVKGAERVGTRTIRIESDDALAAFRSFVAVTYITRQAGGR